MLRHLRQVLADQPGIGHAAVGDLRLVVEIGGGKAHGRRHPILDVGLHAANLGAAEVLLLRQRGRERHVRHRVLDAVVEERHPRGEVLGGRDVQAQFAAHQPLGTEFRVWTRHDGAHRELAVELRERGRAEARVHCAPGGDPIGEVVERGHARTEHRVGAVGQRVAIVGGRQPRGHRGFEIVPVVVAPLVGAGAERDHRLRGGRDDVGDERAQAALRAARDAPQRTRHPLRDAVDHGGHGRHIGVFLAVAVDPAHVGAGAQHLRAAEHLGPLQHAAHAVGGHLLIGGQAHHVAQGGRVGDGQEVEVRALPVQEHVRLQRAVIGQLRLGADAARGPLGVVHLAHLGVGAVLGKPADAQEGVQAIGRIEFDLRGEIGVLDVGVVVDRTAFTSRHDREARGVERAAFHRQAHALPAVAGEEIDLRRVAVAVLGLHLQRAARGPAGDHIDHAAHGDVAVEARGRVLGDLDLVDAEQRHPRPVDPAAERVVEGHAVEQHQRAALAARADAAQRHALRGRLGRQAARAPEQAEARHLAQDVVGHHGRRVPDGLAGHDVDAGWHRAETALGAGRAHHHGFEHRRRREHNLDLAGSQRPLRLGESLGAHHQRGVAARHLADQEAALAVGHGLLQPAGRRAHRHGRADNHLPVGVLHHAGDARGGLGEREDQCQYHRDAPLSETCRSIPRSFPARPRPAAPLLMGMGGQFVEVSPPAGCLHHPRGSTATRGGHRLREGSERHAPAARLRPGARAGVARHVACTSCRDVPWMPRVPHGRRHDGAGRVRAREGQRGGA